MSVSSTLLSAVKIRTNHAWADSVSDDRLKALIEDGMSYIDSLGGEAYVYDENLGTVNQKALSLLSMYVFYADSNASDEFQQNYSREILQLRALSQAGDYYASTQS
jgi:hypothetical protein